MPNLLTLPQPSFIFFDLDDTLVDDAIATHHGVEHFFKQYAPNQLAQAHQLWQAALDTYYPAFLDGEISSQALIRARMRFVLENNTLTDESADQLFNEFLACYISNTTLYPDTLSTINKLKKQGIRLGIISNGVDRMQRLKLETAQLSQYFEVILTAEQAGIGKPSPRIFEHALSLANSDKSEAWYVGDNLEKDAIAATDAGLVGVLLDRQQRHYTYTGYKIQSLSELLR